MFIFSNLAMSLDGKIATRVKGLHPLGTAADRLHMEVLRAKADAIVIGAQTLRTHPWANTVPGQKQQPINVFVSSSLQGLSVGLKVFNDVRINRMIFLTDPKKLSERKRAQLSKGSSLFDLRRPKPSDSSQRSCIATQIIRVLKKQGIKRLLVEGGGTLMWEFARFNLIDEYHVTLTPKIVGGVSAPTLVDGLGFLPSQILRLKLTHCKRLKNELYLTYSRN